MDLREQLVQSQMGQCRHFNGFFANKTCLAGVAYKPQTGLVAMPCIIMSAKGRQIHTCDLISIPTREEAEKLADVGERNLKAHSMALEALSQEVKKQKFGKGRPGAGTITCPACGDGTLRYSIEGTRGHIRAVCSTAKCVKMIQ